MKTVNLGNTLVKIDKSGIVNHKEFQSKHTFGLSCNVVNCTGGGMKVSKSGLLFCPACMDDYNHIKKMNFKGGLSGIIYLVLIVALQKMNMHQAKAAKLLIISARKLCYLIGKMEIKSKNPAWMANGVRSVSNVTKDNKLRLI